MDKRCIPLLLTVLGCARSHVSGGPTEGFLPVPLIDEVDVAALSGANELDSLELRIWDEHYDAESWWCQSELISSIGHPCGGATDSEACSIALNVLRNDEHCADATCWNEGVLPFGRRYDLIATDADRVFRVHDLRTLLPIDSPDEIRLLLLVRAVEYREVDDGYEVIASEVVSSCVPLIIDKVLYHLSPEGDLTERRRGHLRYEEESCI